MTKVRVVQYSKPTYPYDIEDPVFETPFAGVIVEGDPYYMVFMLDASGKIIRTWPLR